MKKILLLTGFVGASFCLDAQTAVTPPNAVKPAQTQHMSFDLNKLKARQPRTERSETFWLNYGSSVDQALGGGPGSTGPAELNSNYLFPDSTIMGEFGTGNFSSVWIHHLGDILDVKSDIFDIIDGCNWDATNSYSLDSMSIVYAYTRNFLSVTDTLIVTLLTNSVATNLYSSGFIGATAANYGTDTVGFKTLNYSTTTNMATGTGRYTFKIPLTDADADPTNFLEKAFAVPGGFTVPAGKLLACDVMFKPGYSWTPGDHVDDFNAFFFASNEENGATTFPTYYDCNYQSVACDYNVSSIVPQDVRYATAATWNGKFIPSYAYTDAYAFEHHFISYHVTSPAVTTGVNEVANQFALNQNQPNPFNDQTTISYQLNKAAGNVTVQIFDVTGVKLFEQSENNVKAGAYSFDINTANYASGLYFYSITVDGAKVTKKMVANK